MLVANEMCARTHPAKINRNIQMRQNVIHNQSGPLERSTTFKVRKLDTSGVEDRLVNLETQLNLQIGINFTKLSF